MTTMFNPAHPAESLRDALAAEDPTVTEPAPKLGSRRQIFSRLLNGRTGMSPAMALALKRIRRSNAPFSVRLRGLYDLLQERARQERVGASLARAFRATSIQEPLLQHDILRHRPAAHFQDVEAYCRDLCRRSKDPRWRKKSDHNLNLTQTIKIPAVQASL